jgi:AhpD family alkylhydroperoxidase
LDESERLIAPGLAISKLCDGCIASHARGAVRIRHDRGGVAEALGVVIMMNGGSGAVYGPRALAAF